MSIGLLFTALAGVFSVSGCASAKNAESGKAPGPVILVAAFGSSYPGGQRNLEDFDRAVRLAFPGHEVYWGLTASFIVEKLRKNGIKTLFESQTPLLSIEEAYALLALQGRKNILTVNFLLMNGSEYRQVLSACEGISGLNIKYVHPLLYYEENIENTVRALAHLIPNTSEAAAVFCAHGNSANPEYNAELEKIDRYLRANYRNAWLVSMEGTPAWEPVRQEISASGASRVQFITFMLTSGDHITNDVMGEGTESLRGQLGLRAEVSDGLASIPSFQNMFLQRMRRVMDEFDTEQEGAR
ncbi:MAG: hypothetical protein B0D92_00895 [Spirochaeta sp. LUC14_002_19_P3]|nr:MAG: hypothetical protein B0D92_00895 [Spirochaeta sp. LUC14_002_19_P3]